MGSVPAHTIINQVLSQAAIIRLDLNKAGLTTNEDKSLWVPTKTITWVGFLINLRKYVIKVSESKIIKTI